MHPGMFAYDYRGKHYHAFLSEGDHPQFKNYMDQETALSRKEITVPQIHPNYFLQGGRNKGDSELARAIRSLTLDSEEPQGSTSNAETAASNVVTSESNETVQKESSASVSATRCENEQQASGYMLVDIDLLIDFIAEIQDHAKACQHSMKVVDSRQALDISFWFPENISSATFSGCELKKLVGFFILVMKVFFFFSFGNQFSLNISCNFLA